MLLGEMVMAGTEKVGKHKNSMRQDSARFRSEAVTHR